MNNLDKRFAVAVNRRSNKLMLIEPNGNKYFVDENILKTNDITLGQCCLFDVANGIPYNFRRYKEPYETGVTFEVVDNLVEIVNVPGRLVKLTSSNDFYFETNKFKNAAFLKDETNAEKIEEIAGKVGQNFRLRLRLLEEDEKTGCFSSFIWAASINRTGRKTEPPQESNKTKDFKIFGLVVGGFGPKKFVWAKETYPGADGCIVTNDHDSKSLPVGTWVEVEFNSNEFSQYFPTPTSNQTSRFYSNNFKIVSPLLPTKTNFNAKTVIVTLNNFKISEHHTAGDDLFHPLLGFILDDQSCIKYGPGEYTIKIVRSLPKQSTRSEILTVWKVKRAFNSNMAQASNAFVPNNRMTKRALITKIDQNKMNPAGLTCFLWLLDDHIESIYHTNTAPIDLKEGSIFEGTFFKRGLERFECISHDQLLNEKLTSIGQSHFYENQLEMAVTITERNDQETIPSTKHDFFGKIEEVELTSIELINEFEKAWKLPFIRKLIGVWSYEIDQKLNEYYQSKNSK